VIGVPNARLAMACLYDAWYGHPAKRLRLVGVTGTNGKTSVSTMLHRILRAAGIPCGLIGTVGCYLPHSDHPLAGEAAEGMSGMTTPDPATLYAILARMAEESPSPKTTVVMEVTSHALHLCKVSPLTFDLAVFTNLSSEHMDLHGTMEDYYQAKLGLFEVTRQAVVNADDRWGRRLLAEPTPIHHYHICHAEGLAGLAPDRMCPAGEGTCTRYYAEQVKFTGEDGVAFKLASPDIRLRLRCPVPGQFTVMNAMEAAVAALALGVSPATVRDALALFGGVPGRMERVILPETDIPYSVFIDFAHTPDALEKLLASVHGFRKRGQRIVLVFGCGGDRDRSKRKVMARIASRMADSLVITSDNSRSEDPDEIIGDILAGVDKESEFAVVPNRAEAIRYATRHARPGDIILLAGKGHENYEIDRTGKHPFCEKDIAVEAARKYHVKDSYED
jgi:UDP-N-acetylmuramoyl-L-alanyl-D-glutamate--2,6-diaminopimelate ligase